MWRAALPEDDPALCRLAAALYAEDPSPVAGAAGHMPQTLRALRAAPQRGRALACERAGTVVGYALLIAYWSNELGGEITTIDELYVAPEARGQGLGTALIEQVSVGRHCTAPPVALMLEVTPDNARAQALYARLGFSGKNHSWRKMLGGAQPNSAS